MIQAKSPKNPFFLSCYEEHFIQVISEFFNLLSLLIFAIWIFWEYSVSSNSYPHFLHRSFIEIHLTFSNDQVFFNDIIHKTPIILKYSDLYCNILILTHKKKNETKLNLFFAKMIVWSRKLTMNLMMKDM